MQTYKIAAPARISNDLVPRIRHIRDRGEYVLVQIDMKPNQKAPDEWLAITDEEWEAETAPEVKAWQEAHDEINAKREARAAKVAELRGKASLTQGEKLDLVIELLLSIVDK